MKVSELNLKAKALLEAHFNDIILSGELSKITLHNSGHWYFELKDEKSSIACAMFKGANSKVDFKPEVGDFVDLSGSLSLYEPSGRYQFIATSMQKAGFGDLEAKFLALKAKLEKEGLFDSSHKKAKPPYPSKVAIITSYTSAALQDMLKLIKEREYNLATISIFDSLTQGISAPASLIKALQKADNMGFDILILARGGGSREDLFCFNDEALARSIYELKTPIVSAIGHEIDYVISDFVADFRASTPSAAVELIFPSKNELEQSLDLLEDKLKNFMQNKIENASFNLNALFKQLRASSLSKIIEEKIAQLTFLQRQFIIIFEAKVEQCILKLTHAEAALKQNEAFFAKSKKLVSLSKNGHIIELDKLKSGDEIELHSQNSLKKAQIL